MERSEHKIKKYNENQFCSECSSYISHNVYSFNIESSNKTTEIHF